MTIIPDEINQLNVVSFTTNFSILPNVDFFCQRVNIPAVNLGVYRQPTPLSDAPTEGDKIDFEQFAMNFIVNEDLSNYLEIYNWLIAMGFPDDHNQFNLAKNLNQTGTKTIRSDMNIIINTNKSNPNYSVTFKDAFPISLGSIELDASATSLEPIIVDATFEFVGSFSIDKIT